MEVEADGRSEEVVLKDRDNFTAMKLQFVVSPSTSPTVVLK
jgi:hypothetical protein